MGSHGSTLRTRFAAALAICALAAQGLACQAARDESEAERVAASLAPETPQGQETPAGVGQEVPAGVGQEVPAGVGEGDVAPTPLLEDAATSEPAARKVQKLRALGYAAEPAAAQEATAPAAPAGGKPDAESLSQLAYQSSQSLNQRANEALDYLGAPSFAASDAAASLSPSSGRGPADERFAAPSEQPALASRTEPRSRPEAVGRFRDGLARPAKKDAKARAARLREGARADSFEERKRERPADSPVLRFERERRSLEGLAFQPATGYWANTYVPGDPVMRWLEARLEKRDRSALQAFAAGPLRLDAAAHQTPQPFDPPRTAALSVFLQADRRGIDGESRMLVQVGLQGADRQSGLRPAMSVGIVLDVRGGVPTEVATSMRALADGFLAAKDVGDRFSLSVAGQPGAMAVAPDAFRFGPVSLAMAGLGERGAGGGAPPVDLEDAVRSTCAALRRSDDPSAPLGSSMVLLVTSQPLGPLADRIAAVAHESAVAGVPVSVVGVGDGVPLAEIERVALAGQGNRRLLRAASDAERLVERELSALSGVIARAVRLRIRLAPGVKLVDVVGSEPLDAAGAQRVRRAEQSIDRRLARNLGIEADRGEDEEGIQIVLPTFHSGDSHAVLLDVVAPGAGPIADVTVRYKDLVYLRNSVARANLSLGRSEDPPGPLERNVVKNLLAIRLSETLKQAGRGLLAGADAEAIAAVREFQTLLQGVQRNVAGFQNDADLAGDVTMLEEYLAVLGTGALQHDPSRQVLADSLQLSGYFKTVPRGASELHVSRR